MSTLALQVYKPDIQLHKGSHNKCPKRDGHTADTVSTLSGGKRECAYKEENKCPITGALPEDIRLNEDEATKANYPYMMTCYYDTDTIRNEKHATIARDHLSMGSGGEEQQTYYDMMNDYCSRDNQANLLGTSCRLWCAKNSRNKQACDALKEAHCSKDENSLSEICKCINRNSDPEYVTATELRRRLNLDTPNPACWWKNCANETTHLIKASMLDMQCPDVNNCIINDVQIGSLSATDRANLDLLNVNCTSSQKNVDVNIGRGGSSTDEDPSDEYYYQAEEGDVDAQVAEVQVQKSQGNTFLIVFLSILVICIIIAIVLIIVRLSS